MAGSETLQEGKPHHNFLLAACLGATVALLILAAAATGIILLKRSEERKIYPQFILVKIYIWKKPLKMI